MLKLSHETLINRAPEVVFPVAADPANQLKWDAGGMQSVEKLSDGPLARGSRYRGRWKRFGVIEYEFAAYDPPHLFTHDATMSLGRVLHEMRCESDNAGGTRFVQEAQLTAGPVVRLLWPVLKPLLRRRMEQIGRELKAYVEALPVTGHATGPAGAE